MVSTYKLCLLTSICSIKSEYTVQWIKWSLTTSECPNHSIVDHIISSWINFNLTYWFRLRRWRQTVSMTPILLVKLEIINYKSPQGYENITYSSIAYWMQSSILFCCTETNNILRAESSSADAVLSIRTFTWSWCSPVSRLWRPAWGQALSHPVYMLTKITTTCLRSRHLYAEERHTRTMVF